MSKILEISDNRKIVGFQLNNMIESPKYWTWKELGILCFTENYEKIFLNSDNTDYSIKFDYDIRNIHDIKLSDNILINDKYYYIISKIFSNVDNNKFIICCVDKDNCTKCIKCKNVFSSCKKYRSHLKDSHECIDVKEYIKNIYSYDNCCICMEKNPEIILKCGHKCLCKNCYTKILEKKCPICRYCFI